ncbi:hypothetical protein EYF80_015426 [Liparis tanakae]|uniref:Uncharacterized protein n=1 Tax=Liparis tanakae TaxID=230148 RepID=A0A4Z2IB31_9TELE|nr:hypothetical protein EYF80_015426 [Liparis tanakae]
MAAAHHGKGPGRAQDKYDAQPDFAEELEEEKRQADVIRVYTIINIDYGLSFGEQPPVIEVPSILNRGQGWKSSNVI